LIVIGRARHQRRTLEEDFMARAKSKAGRKGGGGRKKATSKRGGRKAAASKRGGRKASARSKAGARKATSKRGRKTARGGRSTGTTARSTRTAARKTGRSAGTRGRKTRAGQTAGTQTSGAEGGSMEGGEGGSQIEGEGSYTASRHFRKAQTDFVRRNRSRIGKMGKNAEAALEGPEGGDLQEAENEARSHAAGEE
jgi:hypothetical protein